MLITIEVNRKKLKAEKGETILKALNRNGINIPTLCRLRGLTPTGACRICVVEVEGEDMLVTACSEPVREWMKIKTHSPRVIRARKSIVELLLSNHPDNCLYCDRNLNCELQSLAGELNIRERRLSGNKLTLKLDQSSPAITRELSKCILCGRCVRICEEVVGVNTLDFIGKGRTTHIGTTMDKDFNFSSCIHCGQCVTVCPTGALHEKHNIREVQDYLTKKDTLKVIQFSPLVAFSVAREMGLKYSQNFDKKLSEALVRIGFDRVYYAGFGSDIMINELTEQLVNNKAGKLNQTIYTSHCPAWVKYAEQFMPGLLEKLSDLKSPQQITGALIKTLVSAREEVSPENIYSVSATLCTAAKYEARRDVMTRKGISDIETILTVRELVQLLKLYGINMDMLDGRNIDEPLNLSSFSALITEVSGGLTEALVKNIARDKGFELSASDIRKLRTAGDFRELMIRAGEHEYNFALVDGLTGLDKLSNRMGSVHYDLVEIMVCQSGCVNGGGVNSDENGESVRDRIKMVYKSEGNTAISMPMDNPALRNFYEKWLPFDKDLSDKKIFKNKYSKKNVLL
ncbi:MAG: [Fe-Fe] hydrogenase large subunit C-terminal domain-containing protein [Bacteroidales bacterium]|nr:[Fe-Fe] hydrogenase large subunit C-terminal domain-containing protein [Bacteroidales bacterium]